MDGIGRVPVLSCLRVGDGREPKAASEHPDGRYPAHTSRSSGGPPQVSPGHVRPVAGDRYQEERRDRLIAVKLARYVAEPWVVNRCYPPRRDAHVCHKG